MPEQAKNSMRLQLEKLLRNDREGADRDALLQRLEQCALEIKAKMDAGLPPDEYARLDKVSRALTAGAGVVTRVWRRAHPA